MGGMRKVISTNIGVSYTLTLQVDMGTAEGLYIMPRTTNGGNIYTGTNLAQVYVTSSGTYTVNFTATTGTTQLLVEKAGSVEKYFYIDNVKVEQSTPTLNSYPIADVVSAQHYYPFGSTMQTWEADGMEYAFGFNGKEKDNETGTQDYGFRIYNPRLGKFLSVDPLTKDYPWYTPYQFAGNKPIWAIDLDGLEELLYQSTLKDNYGFKATIALANMTTLGKEFKKVLLSQNKLDVYYFSFSGKGREWIHGDGYKTVSIIDVNEQGFQEGRPGFNTGVTTVVYSIEDIIKLKTDNTYFNVNPSDLESSFKAGKGVVLIGVTEASFNIPHDQIGFDKNKIANFRASGAETIVQEESAHAQNILANSSQNWEYNQNVEYSEHKGYHGKYGDGSPDFEEYLSDEYSNTKAGKSARELVDLARTYYKKTQ